MWASPALFGATHDLAPAHAHGLLDALTSEQSLSTEALCRAARLRCVIEDASLASGFEPGGFRLRSTLAT